MLCISLSEFIRYENPRLGSKASYTGQISEWMWKHKATGKSVNEYTYGFSYDALNRFRGNKQYLNGKPENRYTEDISYDLNGNPLALKRSGSGRANYSSFAYEGNRMVSFRDGDRTYKYEYDANGNCTKDGMKNLILEYNHLNLPEKIKSGNTLKAVYSWSAEGTKLGVSDAAGYGRHYMGNLIYAKDAKGLRAEAVIFPGGLIRVASDGSQEIDYFLCDHLGSVRVIFNAGGKVVERNDYYASGKAVVREDYPRQAGNRYKYNGKEEQTTGNLGYLDYGARMYETSSGRWLTVDPMAESYYSVSPYAYCANNPVNFIDPTGMIWEDPQEAERLKRNIDNRITSLNKDIAKNQNKLAKGGLSEKQVRKLEDKISEANNRISNLNISKADIDVLGADQNNVYALSPISGGEHKVRQGSDGKVYIETSSDALSIHEITHVRQSLDAGGLKFSTNGELLNAGVGIRGISNMEIEAYKMQYSYDRSFPGSLGGRGLQGIDIHSVGSIINDGKHVYPAIYQYSIELNKFFKQQKKLIGGGK